MLEDCEHLIMADMKQCRIEKNHGGHAWEEKILSDVQGALSIYRTHYHVCLGTLRYTEEV